MSKRPISVVLIACLYIVTGAVGFLYHFNDLTARAADAVWVEVVRLSAIVAGIFLLRAQNWARWLALAWMAFHVVIGALHSMEQFAIHLLFLGVIGYLLFRPEVNRYFRVAPTSEA